MNLPLSDIWKTKYPLPRPAPERPRAHEAELTRRDGEPLPATVVVAPLEGADDNERLISFLSRAELERLSDALSHAQRLAGIGTLTASVAHELTNPISIITATCSNLLDELEDGEVEREQLLHYMELIEQGAFRAARIVEVLRNYTHNGDDGPAVAVTSPSAIVGDALVLLEQQFRKQARVTIEVDLDEGVRTVFCDHNRITQVLINLLTNARDAMQPQGGVIGLRCWAPDPGSAERERFLHAAGRAGEQDADLVALAVADSGTGINPAIKERIFEPFFTTKANGQGTGLGLFIARGIVEQHGGAIWAENNPRGGATVTVVLPRVA